MNARADYAWGSNTAYGYTSVDGKNELFSLTGTVDYALWKNVISRIEARWDTTLTDDKPFGGIDADYGNDKNALSVAVNFIYQF